MNNKITRTIDTTKATGAELVAWYNENSGQKAIKRFPNLAEGARKCTELQEALLEMASTKSKSERSRGDAKEKRTVVDAILGYSKASGTPENAARTKNQLQKMGLPELKGILAELRVATPPAPKPVEAPVPPAPTTPEQIELEREGHKGKRYVSKTDPTSKYHLRDRSERMKPVDYVRCVCNDNPKLSRKEIIALCIEAGVNKNTAATQYSLWKAAKLTQFPAGGPGAAESMEEAEGSED